MSRLQTLVVMCCVGFVTLPPAVGAKKGAKKPPAAATSAPAPAAPAAASSPAATTESGATAPAASPPASTATPEPAATAAVGPAPSSTPAAAPADGAPPQPVLTPEQEALAKKHYSLGEQAFRERRFEVALTEFTAAFDIMKHPDLLYNLHKAALKLGQKDKAIEYLREYKRYRPAEAESIDKDIAQINASEQPAPVPVIQAPPPAPETVASSGPPRTSGKALIGIGTLFVATGVAVLGTSYALASDTYADQSRNQAMQITGAFMTGAGGLALIGGIVITVTSRTPPKVSWRSGGSGLRLAGLF